MKKKSTLLWIWRAAKPQVPLLILLSLFSIVGSVSYILPALLSRRAVNAAFNDSFAAAKKEILYCGLMILLVVLGQLLLAVLSNHLRAVISGRLEMRLRHDLFESITKKEYEKITKHHSGDILTRFTADVDVVVSGVTGFVPQALSIVSKIIAGLIVLASFSGRFAVAVVCVGVFMLLCAALFKPFYKKLHKRVQEATGVVRGFTQECVENIVVVKTFSTRLPLLKKLDNYMREVYRTKILRNNVSNAAYAGVSLIFTAGYYMTLCWGALCIAGGSMDHGTLTAFLEIVAQIQSPFFNASGLLTQYYSAQASAERLMELENLPDDAVDPDFDARAVYEKAASLCVESLSFGYGMKPILKNTDFSVKKGSVAALTGSSGTGKSTLFKLLLGLYPPDCGRLYLKTESGDEIELGASTRPLFAYVPQGNLLLSGTIRDNIKFGSGDVSDDVMEEAAKTACIYDYILTLPDGFDTEIGERGAGLSEGQIQRIAVARALCSGAPILLLDECTSALDAQTEEQMLKNIAAMRTRTVFFISHKNAALSICNAHLHMEKQRIELVETA